MTMLQHSVIESGGYNIQRSLRFRSSASAYLDRTLTTPTNNKIYTWSGWVKKGIIGTANRKVLFSARNGTNEDYFCYDDTNDNLRFFINSTNASTTSAVYRDASAWYHVVLVVDTTQATAANRVSIYVNGTLAANANGTAPTQNSNTVMNGAYSHRQGAASYNGPWYFDGYLAEVNFIDGQALTPSSFGYTEPLTGVWQPLKYAGTYGTNGFYLPFTDNTSATTLAYDKSGNGNNWTANNISTTSGATYDSMTDVPTLTSATAANYCVLNAVNKSTTAVATVTNGNLNFSGGSSGYFAMVYATFAPNSGKWYWEVAMNASGQSTIGISNPSIWPNDNLPGFGRNTGYGTEDGYSYHYDGKKYHAGTGSTYGSSFASGDIIGIAYDIDNGTLTFYKNNTSQGQAFSSISGTYAPALGGYTGNDVAINFGQRPFSYTPPTGFKALNTFNLPDPTIKKPNQYMDATTYTGAGGTQSITNAGSFQPDLVWMKCRNVAGTGNILQDSVRGATKGLESQTTGAEFTDATTLTSFNSNGFTVGGNSQTNGNGNTFVGWQWKESATAGFDIVTYTGNGAASRTISHNLGVTPKMVIVKARSRIEKWCVSHTSLATNGFLFLNLTDAASTASTIFQTASFSSSVFAVGDNAGVNNNGDTYVAYLFAEIAGFSKFGSYTGNGSTDGPFVYCGFRPKYVMVKSSNLATTNWVITDTSRNPYNVSNLYLRANTSDSELTATNTSGFYVDALSNGFKIRGNGGDINNSSSDTYIYAAFAENPFKYSLAR